MRRLLATAALATLAFPGTAAAGSVFLLVGGGWGHGVGMSQYGAQGYALHGWSWQRILAHYYPHTTVSFVQPRPVRVLLVQRQPRVTVGSAAPFLLADARGHRIHVAAGALRLTPALRYRKLTLAQPVRVEPGAQPLTLAGAGYRGELDLEVRGGRLQVVNVVPLELYLRGVVPWEMPWSWTMQAFEAQAVVARSYALATMHPTADFDLYADDRSQEYGGIRAERQETSDAVGATAGRVLTYGGVVVTAYYSASSGGRTAGVHDVWPRLAPEPYLVPVPDPFDSLSPYHRWSALLRPQGLASRFHVPVEDVRVVADGSGRAHAVELVGPAATRTISGDAFRQALGLRSTYFSVGVLSLADPPRGAVYGQPYALRGFLRGVRGAVLQELGPDGTWRQAARIRAHGDGRFEALVEPSATTEYRLAVGGEAGDPVAVPVARRIAVRADGSVLAGKVLPAAPVRVERRVRDGWRPVGQVEVGPSGYFRTQLRRSGQYRVAAAGGARYLASASPPVSVAR